MAQAFPSLILDTVIKQLESPVFQSKSLNSRLRFQLRELHLKLELFREVIDDAEWMAFLFPDVVRKSVCKLQCVLYEVDDLLDEALTRRMPTSGNMVEKVRLYFCNVPFHLTLAHELKSMNTKLVCIMKEWYDCNLIVEEPGKPQPSTTMGASQRPVVKKGILHYNPNYVKDDELQMIGRDFEKQEVISLLLDEDSESIVCVTGDAGAGKTTLCRAVYIDEDVRNGFEIRLWVQFEGTSDCCSIIFWKKIIATLIRPDEAHLYLEMEDADQLRDEIVSLIKGRKTLLVLDNVTSDWCDDEASDNMKYLQALIPKCHKGNKILFLFTSPTLELSDDATYPAGTYIHELYELPEEDLWSIFENNAFILGDEKAGQSAAPWKIDKGKQIVRRCGGNPALLRGIGTLLYGKDDRDLWEYFARDFDFESQHHRYAAVSEVGKLFPKCQQPIGYLSLLFKNEIKLEILVKQLAAHGSANSSNVTQMLESILFEPFPGSDKWNDEEVYVVSQEYLIQLLAGGETAVLGWTESETDVPEATRHVSIARPSSSRYQPPQKRILPDSLIKDVIHRRSLLFPGLFRPVKMSAQTLETLASNLRYLRVLDLNDLGLTTLPSSVGKLIHLKYLDLSRNDFRVLPKSVCGLKNLWVLRLNYCDKLIKLPRHIKSLNQLKHLEISMCFYLTAMPSRIVGLTGLESLDWFVVCPHKGGLRYLRNLDNLKGKLSIELPRRWKRSTADAEEANLQRKVGLTELEFKWQGATIGVGDNNDYSVLEKLKPFNGIKSLSIIGFGGTKLSSWIASLDLLTKITISQCTSCEILPPLHRMPCLSSLTLASMNMKYLQDDKCNGDESCAVSSTSTVFFPALKELKIGKMFYLKGWWSRDTTIVGGKLPSFPSISMVEIWNCPYFTKMPPFSEILTYSVFQDVSEKMLQSIHWDTNENVKLISIQDMDSLPNQLVSKPPVTLLIKDCNQWQSFYKNEVKVVEAWNSSANGFRRLDCLTISNCPALMQMSTGLEYLTNLTELRISKCSEELDSLYKEEKDGMPWKALQKLKLLEIKGFENLVDLPRGIQHLHTLERLYIKDCKALKHLSSSLKHLSNLTELCISKCSEELDSLYKEDEVGMPWKALQKLKLFEIKGFENLVDLPKGIQDLRTLEKLYIKDCKALKHLSSSLKHLCNLFYLKISRCSEELDCLYKKEEDGMPWKALKNLAILEIKGFEHFVALSKDIHNLPRLNFLCITDCKALKWEVGSLPKLDHLTIKSCPNFFENIDELKREHPGVKLLE